MPGMQKLIIKQLGLVDYVTTWRRMQAFTNTRNFETIDELWLLEHPPVFTQGQAGKAEHVIKPSNIPIVQSDRGGQVTYHGPGQLVAYTLFDLNRLKISIRKLICKLEQSVISVLADYGIESQGKRAAPGIYVNDGKICSIGLRIKRGYAYHGLAFNIDMDLQPFTCINPCGFQGLKITQLADFIHNPDKTRIQEQLVTYLSQNFEYNRLR